MYHPHSSVSGKGSIHHRGTDVLSRAVTQPCSPRSEWAHFLQGLPCASVGHKIVLPLTLQNLKKIECLGPEQISYVKLRFRTKY